MPESLNNLLSNDNLIAYRAVAALCKSCLCAGCRNGRIDNSGVTLCRNYSGLAAYYLAALCAVNYEVI